MHRSPRRPIRRGVQSSARLMNDALMWSNCAAARLELERIARVGDTAIARCIGLSSPQEIFSP